MAHNNTARGRDLLHGSLGDKIILFVLPLAATGLPFSEATETQGRRFCA